MLILVQKKSKKNIKLYIKYTSLSLNLTMSTLLIPSRKKYAFKRSAEITYCLNNSYCDHHKKQKGINKPCKFVFNHDDNKETEIHGKFENLYVKNFTFHCSSRPSKKWYILNPRKIHTGEGDYVHVDEDIVIKIKRTYVTFELTSYIASLSIENENKCIGMFSLQFYVYFIHISLQFYVYFIYI